MDESLYVAVPPTGVIVTNTAESVEKEYWVDPDSGSDENAGTSSATPLKTLAKAVGLLSPTERTLVHCAAGDYADGDAAEGANGKSRLAILDYRTLVRFKGAGRGVSFISGAPDADSVAAGDGSADGRRARRADGRRTGAGAPRAVGFVRLRRLGGARPGLGGRAGVLKGESELVVEVTSTGANRLRWNDQTGVKWKYFEDANMRSVEGTCGGADDLDASTWPLADAGLLGPVRLFAQ